MLIFFVEVTAWDRVTEQVGVLGRAIIKLTDKDGELSNCVCFADTVDFHILDIDDVDMTCVTGGGSVG